MAVKLFGVLFAVAVAGVVWLALMVAFGRAG